MRHLLGAAPLPISLPIEAEGVPRGSYRVLPQGEALNPSGNEVDPAAARALIASLKELR